MIITKKVCPCWSEIMKWMKLQIVISERNLTAHKRMHRYWRGKIMKGIQQEATVPQKWNEIQKWYVAVKLNVHWLVKRVADTEFCFDMWSSSDLTPFLDENSRNGWSVQTLSNDNCVQISQKIWLKLGIYFLPNWAYIKIACQTKIYLVLMEEVIILENLHNN